MRSLGRSHITMTIVFVVNYGEYSDTHIVGIFTTREKAEQYILKNRNSKYNDKHYIEEHVLE